jgi:ATP-dependent protease ClpP protease subunit
MRLLLLLTFLFQVFSMKTVNLTLDNTLLLRGVIDEESTNKLMYDIQKTNATNKILYLDTPGGMVEEGLKIINEVRNYNISCVAEKAYSMGFSIFQSCYNRYILPNGKLMQHQISFGIGGELAKVNNYVNFIKQIEEEIVELEATRIDIPLNKYREMTTNEWWLYGTNTINSNTADEIVNVKCSNKLTRKNFTMETNRYIYVYSSCPLISNEIEIKEKKKDIDTSSFEDLFYFL